MKSSAFVVLALLAGCCFTVGVIATVKDQEERKIAADHGDCWPISPSLSTGTVRCWSGGKLVYNRAVYHNGGVLCSVDGQQITLNKADLCVVESSQSNVWSPPPPVDR